MSLTKIISEALVLTNFNKYAIAVTEAYKARGKKESPEKMRSWEILRNHNNKMFKRLQSKVEVVWTSDDPYETAEQMRNEVESTGKMYITTEYSDGLQSGWSKEDNWKFRAVHDYIVHIGGNHDFSLRGEIGAYNTHAKIAPPDALPALFSEVVGQVCYVTVVGEFPSVQKACYLYGFDYDQVGRINWEEYKKNFILNPIRTYSESQIETIINKVKF